MNIQEALEETGKAYPRGDSFLIYAQVNTNGELQYFSRSENSKDEKRGIVPLQDIIEQDWQPFNPVVEISPESAGELWENSDGYPFMTTNRNSAPFVNVYGDNISISGVIHGKNGWKLLYSPNKEVMERINKVEDVERIEIEGVEWAYDEEGGVFYPYRDDTYGEIWESLKDKPSMKMILEIPKTN